MPDRAEIMITRLTVPGETKEVAAADLRSLVDSLGLKSEIMIDTPPPSYEPYSLNAVAPIVTAFNAAYQDVIGKSPHFAGHRGITDANVFVAEAGIPTVVFGPKGGRHHMAGEFVDLASLEPVVRTYIETARRFFAGD